MTQAQDYRICVQDNLIGGYMLTSSCNQINATSAKAGCTSQTNQTCTGRLKPEFAAAYNGSADYPRTLVDKAHDLGIGVIISFFHFILTFLLFPQKWVHFSENILKLSEKSYEGEDVERLKK